MTTTRESLAGPAKIGGIEFYATGASGPGAPRRIIRYGGIGVEGQVTEDVGRDARVEGLSAIVDESVWIKLDNLKNEAKVITAVHPLFGVLQARIQDVTYQAGPEEMVQIQVTLIEHGEPEIFNPLSTLTLPGQTQNARAAWSDLNDSFGELNALDIPDGLSSAISDMQDGWDAFDDVLDLAEAGDAIFEDVASAFNGFADIAKDTIDAVDNAWEEATDLVNYAVEDLVYDVLDSARGCVDAIERQAVSVWRNFDVVDPVGIAELAREFLGTDDDDAIQQILDRNPQIVDISAVPAGASISIPVLK